MKCGTIRPINPITPATETLNPVKIDAIIKRYLLVRSIFIPKWIASSSPKANALRSIQNKYEQNKID